MDVTTAVHARISARDFLADPVDDAVLRQLLVDASYAPSGGNLQPWRIYVVNGESMARLREYLPTQPPLEAGEYDIYPKALTEPYRTNRFTIGEQMYATLGIARDDKQGRFQQFARNGDFFGAPAALFCFVDRQMGLPQWSDLGMFLQTVMLLAREAGLHTCAQEIWTNMHRTVGEFIAIPAHQMLFCGMAIGWRDETHPVNRLRTERAPLGEFASFRGI